MQCKSNISVENDGDKGKTKIWRKYTKTAKGEKWLSGKEKKMTAVYGHKSLNLGRKSYKVINKIWVLTLGDLVLCTCSDNITLSRYDAVR